MWTSFITDVTRGRHSQDLSPWHAVVYLFLLLKPFRCNLLQVIVILLKGVSFPYRKDIYSIERMPNPGGSADRTVSYRRKQQYSFHLH